jgi:hypothetical protein
MILDGRLVVAVATGTVIIDRESGKRFRVNDDQGVVQHNLLYVTPERYALLKEQYPTLLGRSPNAPAGSG